MTRARIKLCFLILSALLLTITLAESDIFYRGNNYNNPTLPASSTVEGGLHLALGRQVRFNPHVMKDGGGFRWDLQVYGTVYNGTNQAYGGAMYCQINGNNVRAYNYGWRNKAGDEVEIYDRYSHTRYNNRYRKGLQVFRRIKVYKDRPLARWMDILDNPTNKDITVKVTVYSNYYSTLGKLTTNNGDEKFDNGDTGLVTQQKARSNAPSVMHVYCDDKADVKPQVQKGSSYLNVHYNVTIPAKQTRILVYFQSQGHSHDKQLKALRQFKAWRALKDLNPDVRKIILNFGRVSGYADIDLERSNEFDAAVMSNGDPVFGEIVNTEFRMTTDYGRVILPADDVIGMAIQTDKKDRPVTDGGMKVLLRGGHLLFGKLPGQKLRMDVDGAVLDIPLGHISQCSYKISKQRPDFAESLSPHIVLRRGDRLPIDADRFTLPLETPLGRVDIRAADILHAELPKKGERTCVVTFLNNSSIQGRLADKPLRCDLPLDGNSVIDPNSILKVVHKSEPVEGNPPAVLLLRNEDNSNGWGNGNATLTGKVQGTRLTLSSDGKTESIDMGVIKKVDFASDANSPSVIETWSGDVHRGVLTGEALSFQVGKGTVFTVDVALCKSLTRTQMTAPQEMRLKVAKLVEKMGHEDRDQREDATAELKKMPKIILPVLHEHFRTSRDAEVRTRIEMVIEHFGEKIEGKISISGNASTAVAVATGTEPTRTTGTQATRVTEPLGCGTLKTDRPQES